MIAGWLRPLRREFWRVVRDARVWLRGLRRTLTDWRNWHRFMSTQALGVGTAALSVGIAVEWSPRLLVSILAVTAAMTLAGTFIEQPEMSND
jgi:hypothetical protein